MHRFINVRTVTAALLVALLAGCGASASGSGSSAPGPLSTSSVAAKAMTPDQVANAQLKAAGYTTSKLVPEFGKYAVGINLTAHMRYMVVVTVKNAQDATVVKNYYDQHKQTGVTVTSGSSNGVNFLIFMIDTVKDGKAALEQLGKALHATAKSNL